MNKLGLIVSVLGVIYTFILIVYSMSATWFTLPLHFLLLVFGFLICFLLINKITKSSDSLKSKIYFSFTASFSILFSIIFFWFLGDHSSIDEKGIVSMLVILTTLILIVVSFLTGIILSIKRRIRTDFNYNLKYLSLISTIIFVGMLSLCFFNIIILAMATSLGSEKICYMTLSHPDSGSNMFNSDFQPKCLSEVGIINNDESICEKIREDSYKNRCYYWVIVNKKDIKICFNSPQPFDMSVRCGTAFSNLENEIYNTLRNLLHPDITYAIKATPYLGIYYDESAENKFIPLIKNIVTKGSLGAKKEALEILFTWAGQNSFEEEKRVLRDEILPLIKTQLELQEYAHRINARLNAVVLIPSTSTIKTE